MAAGDVLEAIARYYPVYIGGIIAFVGYRETHRMNNRQTHFDEDRIEDARASQLIEGYRDLLPATMASYEARLKHLEETIEEYKAELMAARAHADSARVHAEFCEAQLAEHTGRLRVAEARITELGG